MSRKTSYMKGALFSQVENEKLKAFERPCNICKKRFNGENRFSRFCEQCKRVMKESDSDNYLEEHSITLNYA